MKTILLYSALALAVATAMASLPFTAVRAHAVADSGNCSNCVAAANARFTASAFACEGAGCTAVADGGRNGC